MKTILMLGGFGFIGSNLQKYIDDNYSGIYEIIIFDKYPKHAYLDAFSCVTKVYSGDFSDESCLEQIFKENRIDIVVHLLSSTVPATSSNAKYDVESNLIPTLNLLSIMDRYSVKDIVYMSSGGAIYGDKLQKVHNEEDAVYPKSSYGVVKLAIEKYLLSYSELYGFNTLVLRLSNPFGRFHYNNKQGVINIVIRKALKGEPIEVWGSGEGIKDYIFIDDVCSIVMRLIEKGVDTDVINVAASNAMSVNEIVDSIKQEIPSLTYSHISASNVDVQNFELDITKLRSRLGVLKFTTFKEALNATIAWQKENI